MKNRHFQTIYSTFFRKLSLLPFKLETFILSDGDFVDCHWYGEEQADYPIVVLYHGLAGSYKSPYIQGILLALKKSAYTVVLMHFRGCSGRSNNLPRSYHSGDTQDAKEFLTQLKQRNPNKKLYAVAYSLGANMLLKLLGEMQEKSLLDAAVAISAPMQLDMCASFIDQGFAKFYQKNLVKELNKSLDKKYDKHPMQEIISLQREKIKNIHSFWDFDAIYTAPVHGFNSAQDYYTKSSAKQFLKHIQVPTLIIHAKDDPFMPVDILPNKDELPSCIKLEVSEHGGHVGFIGGTFLNPTYWTEKRITEFFDSQNSSL